VFGTMRDKDAALMLKTLLPVVSEIVMTEPPTPRARSADELAAIARKLSPRSRIEIVPEPRAALDCAWTYCPVVCAAGSIFLIGDLLARLGPAVRDV
jgi:dihydrofolate synthase / folylpolyglutamate synthase